MPSSEKQSEAGRSVFSAKVFRTSRNSTPSPAPSKAGWPAFF